MNNTPQPKSHRGRCICRAVSYEVIVDASAGSRCNCSFCTKLNPLGSIVKPDAFTLLAGEDKLTRYGHPEAARYFCSTCGVYVYSSGDLPVLGGAFVSVNIQTLDGIDPGAITIMYWDGRHDNWEAGPRDQPWPIFTATDAAHPA